MTKDFIDEQIEVIEIKKTVKKSSKELFKANKANSFEIAGVQVGQKLIVSEEARRKIGDAHKGKFVSAETRLKISEANKGKVRTEEVRKKISDGLLKIQTEERRKKLSEAGKKRVNSEETRKRISESNKGRVVVISQETRIKISESNKGKVLHILQTASFAYRPPPLATWKDVPVIHERL